MKNILILLNLVVINLCLFSQTDSVIFSSEKVGLTIFTQNIDSIKFFSDKDITNPFSPSMITYSVKINTFDTAKLVINFKDQYEKTLVVYKWKMIPPGAYRFDWWEYLGYLPSGIYFTEKIINGKTETKKVVLVK